MRNQNRLRTTPLVNPTKAILACIPALAAIVLLGLVPAIVNLGISFTNYSGVAQSFEFVGFENYIKAFSFRSASMSLWESLCNTIVFSFFTVLIQQALSLGTALLLVRKFRGNSFFRALFFMPTILGVTVVGFIWQMIFDPISGPVAMALHWFGISSALLGQEGLAMALVIGIAVWANFGYSMVIYIAGLNSISEDVEEAAEIDGVNKRQMLMYMTLPLLKDTTVINFWISISGTLSMYDIIFVLTGGTGGTTTFSLFFFKLATNSASNQGQAAALSIYFFLFVTAVMLTFNAVFRRKEAN